MVAPTAIAGTIRASVRSTDRDPNAGHTRPKFTELSVDIQTATADLTQRIDYDQDLIVAGLMLTTFDASANGRTDGFVRAVRVDVTRGGEGTTEILRGTWGELRNLTAQRAGWSDADWASAIGFVFLTLEDERTGDRLVMNAGDSIVVHLDTSATIEEEFTAVALVAGDLLFISRIDFETIAPAMVVASGEDNLAPRAVRDLNQVDTRRLRRAIAGGIGRGPAVARRIRRARRRRA